MGFCKLIFLSSARLGGTSQAKTPPLSGRSGGAFIMRKLRTIEMNRLSLEEFKEADKLPLIVVLDDVRSLHNVGSVFRSADAFRVEAVYLCGITATPPNAEIHKTALGGEDSVDWRYFERTEDAIEELHRQGVFVYSVEQVEGSTKLQDLNTQSPTSHQHPTPSHPLCHRHGQRGERGKAKRCRYERRLS